jgi:hypothetical protein
MAGNPPPRESVAAKTKGLRHLSALAEDLDRDGIADE